MSLKQQKILVVGDDDTQAVLRRIFESAGMQVETAGSNGEGLAAAASFLPAAIVADLDMPDAGGFALLESAKRSALLKGTPVIMLSFGADREALYRALLLGASDFSAKPPRASVLLQKLRRLLKDRQFRSVDFGPADGLRAEARVFGRITHMNESGCIVESSIKLAPETKLQAESLLFEQMGLQALPLRTSASGVRGDTGYMNKVFFVGIQEAAARRIREFIRTWR